MNSIERAQICNHVSSLLSQSRITIDALKVENEALKTENKKVKAAFQNALTENLSLTQTNAVLKADNENLSVRVSIAEQKIEKNDIDNAKRAIDDAQRAIEDTKRAEKDAKRDEDDAKRAIDDAKRAEDNVRRDQQIAFLMAHIPGS